MKKLAMISQPMNGLTDEKIIKARKNAEIYLKLRGYEVVDTLVKEEERKRLIPILERKGVHNMSLWFMLKAVETMTICDMVYFCKGWQDARGCVIEHECAEKYGLDIYEEV